MASPGLAVDCDVAEISELLSGAGGPFVKLVQVERSADDAVVVLQFVVLRIEPTAARKLVLDAVRERASMDARFARWVIDVPSVRADRS